MFSLDIRDQQVQLALDATGESLHRRGFRDDSHVAPMNEILAAGILAKTEWKPDLPFIDGMTGSGTMLIEALTERPNNMQVGVEAFSFYAMARLSKGTLGITKRLS